MRKNRVSEQNRCYHTPRNARFTGLSANCALLRAPRGGYSRAGAEKGAALRQICRDWRAAIRENQDSRPILIAEFADFDPSVPDWRVILKLGFPGMKARLEKYAVKGDPFYDGLQIAIGAMLNGIDSFIEQGGRGLMETTRTTDKNNFSFRRETSRRS